MRAFLVLLVLLAIGILIYVFNFREKAEDAVTPPVVEEEIGEPVTPEVDEQETVALPRFDIVRVDRSGFAVIAGRAAPGAEVTLFANGEALETAMAGADGAWAINTETPLAAGPVELSLSMTTPDGMVVNSVNTIIIYVPENDEDQPVVLRTTPGGATEILQSADAPDGALGPLSINSIDYDDGGNVIFSGRAEPDSVVQVFANRNPVGQANADAQGRWELSTTIPPGRYTLQIIQLDETGNPKYAVEVPFEQASL
ncbi:MAG: Ig-like domain-containing protein, partial [Pseudomonadota bacterium]